MYNKIIFSTKLVYCTIMTYSMKPSKIQFRYIGLITIKDKDTYLLLLIAPNYSN